MSQFPQITIGDLPPVVRQRVGAAIANRHICNLVLALSPKPFHRIASLREELQRHGLYEPVLVKAYQAAGEHRADLAIQQIVSLFELGDKEKLRLCGQPLPSGKSFELYRGVAGDEPRRNTAGLSWTDSRRLACWFAWRLEDYRHLDPAVYTARVDAADVFVFTKGEKELSKYEREFITFPRVPLTRLGLTADEIRREHDKHDASVRCHGEDCL